MTWVGLLLVVGEVALFMAGIYVGRWSMQPVPLPYTGEQLKEGVEIL